MARDPRADILEDDLFPKQKPRIHRVHAHRASDGTIHFNTGGGFMGINNRQPVQLHKGKIWHFSDEEKRHLMLATAAFTFALGLLMAGGILRISAQGGIEQWLAVVLLSLSLIHISEPTRPY